MTIDTGSRPSVVDNFYRFPTYNNLFTERSSKIFEDLRCNSAMRGLWFRDQLLHRTKSWHQWVDVDWLRSARGRILRLRFCLRPTEDRLLKTHCPPLTLNITLDTKHNQDTLPLPILITSHDFIYILIPLLYIHLNCYKLNEG